MHKRTRKLQFDKKTIKNIVERDEECVFCKLGYETIGADPFTLQIKDIMHIVNKSQGGLGIEENGALGCRYHHHLFDNGNKGLRQQMEHDINTYMKSYYHDWNRSKLTYSKY